MLQKISFTLVTQRDDRRRFTHLIASNGVTFGVDKLKNLNEARVALVSDDGITTHEQVQAVHQLTEAAMTANRRVALEYGEGTIYADAQAYDPTHELGGPERQGR